MESTYILVAERAPEGHLKVSYQSEALAIAGAEAFAHLWATITVTSPAGKLVLRLKGTPTKSIGATSHASDSAPTSYADDSDP